MAYYLQFDGSNDRVTIQCQATSSESWSLEWQLFSIPAPDSFGFARIFGGSTAADSNSRISSQIGGGDISARFAGTNKVWSGKAFTNTDKFRIDYNGAQLELFINDVPSGVIAGAVTLSFGLLGCNSNFYTNIALKYATFTNITTPSKSRDYQSSLSNGAGSTLPDAVNSVNGTLVNFPTDNSQWVFYSAEAPGQDYQAEFSSINSSISGISHLATLYASFTSVNASQSSLEVTKQEQNTIFAAFSSSNLSDSELSCTPVLASSFSSINQSDSVSDFNVILTAVFTSSSESFGQVIVYTEPEPSTPIDYGISGFGHNKQWRKSIFFRGR